MKSVALHNLGCKVNAYEMDMIQQMLQEKGYEIVPFDSVADIYIVNTCTVTNIADRKSRQMLHRAKKINPNAVVVAVGCYVQTEKDNAQKEEAVDLCIGNNKKKELVSILEEYLNDKKNGCAHKTLNGSTVMDLAVPVSFEEMTLKSTAEHTRAYVKVQDGCNQFCSYCIIPMARGRVRSRRKEDVWNEVKGLAESGYKEIVVTGIHLSSYGMDFGKEKEQHLLELLEGLHGTEGIERIRLGSLEPRIVTGEFVKDLHEMRKICPHFHLSLQSGCDATLKRMNRHYLTGEYYERIEMLRDVYENPAITTDVIVGFPGETEEEFEITRQFLEKCNFYEMHIFKYSRRKGTNADKMPGQLSDSVKSARSKILQELEKKQSAAYREQFLGREMEVLFEESVKIHGKNYMTGHTKEYIKAAFQTKENMCNHIFTGRAVGLSEENTLLLLQEG